MASRVESGSSCCGPAVDGALAGAAGGGVVADVVGGGGVEAEIARHAGPENGAGAGRTQLDRPTSSAAIQDA